MVLGATVMDEEDCAEEVEVLLSATRVELPPLAAPFSDDTGASTALLSTRTVLGATAPCRLLSTTTPFCDPAPCTLRSRNTAFWDKVPWVFLSTRTVLCDVAPCRFLSTRTALEGTPCKVLSTRTALWDMALLSTRIALGGTAVSTLLPWKARRVSRVPDTFCPVLCFVLARRLRLMFLSSAVALTAWAAANSASCAPVMFTSCPLTWEGSMPVSRRLTPSLIKLGFCPWDLLLESVVVALKLKPVALARLGMVIAVIGVVEWLLAAVEGTSNVVDCCCDVRLPSAPVVTVSPTPPPWSCTVAGDALCPDPPPWLPLLRFLFKDWLLRELAMDRVAFFSPIPPDRSDALVGFSRAAAKPGMAMVVGVPGEPDEVANADTFSEWDDSDFARCLSSGLPIRPVPELEGLPMVKLMVCRCWARPDSAVLNS